VEIENKMQMMTQKRSGHEREGYAIFGTRREQGGGEIPTPVLLTEAEMQSFQYD
jgi:hypothetical protein